MSSATPLLEHRFLHAGAGAGKTTRLIKEIYEKATAYKKMHGDYPNILVCTFTVKATQELKERLSNKAIQEENYGFLSYVNDRSQLLLSTIHGVLYQFLKANALSVGLDPNFALREGIEVHSKVKKIAYGIFDNNKDYTDILNHYSMEEVANYALQYYLAFLQGKILQVASREYLEQLWQNKERQLLEKWQSLLDEAEWICEHLTEKKSKAAPEWQQILLSMQGKQDLKTRFQGLSMPALRQKDIKEVGSKIKAVFEECQEFINDGAYDKDFWLANHNYLHLWQRFLEDFCANYHKCVLQESFVGLSYLEELTYYLLQKDPSFAESFQKKWDYFLIDEFQDTSRLQISILKKMMGAKPYFVVGDAQQSIYLFRGSDVSVFNEVKQEFEEKQLAVEGLSTNYRSDGSLLQFINDVFHPQNFMQMQAHKEVQKNKPVVQLVFEDEKEEVLEAVAAHIKALLQNGAGGKDICVLARTNKELKALKKQLSLHGVVAALSASGDFFHKQAIRDILYFLQLLQMPYNERILLHLLRSPSFKMDDDEIYLALKNKDKNLYVFLKEKGAIEDLVKYVDLAKKESWLSVASKFLHESNFLQTSNFYDPSGISLAAIFKLLDYLYIKEKESGYLVYDIIDKILKGENFGFEDPSHLIPQSQVQLMTVHKSKGLEFPHVFILNLDKAFRSQADKQYFIEVENHCFSIAVPYGKEQVRKHPFYAKDFIKQFKKDELAEHLRLFYVAMTRAEEKLYLCGSLPKNINANSWLAFLPENLRQTGEFGGYKIVDDKASLDQGTNVQEKPSSFMQVLPSISQSGLRYSVSDLLNAKNKDSSNSMDKLALYRSAVQGNEMHQRFEDLKYQDDFKGLDIYKNVFASETLPLSELIQVGEVEWGFAYKNQFGVFEGKIDLWGIVEGELWLVDYKSGSDAYQESAFFQLQAYSLVVRKYVKKEKAKLAVVYPKSGKILVREALPLGDVENQLSSSASSLAENLFSKPKPI